jgi:hypothetical protein
MFKFLPLLFLILILAAPAMAQNGDAPPATAAEGVQWLAVGLAAAAGLLASALTDALKRIPWLTDGDKSKISGPLADLVAALVSVGSAYLLGYLGQVAGFLDQSGLWQVVIFAWPAAKGWFEITTRRKEVILTEVLEERISGPATG